MKIKSTFLIIILLCKPIYSQVKKVEITSLSSEKMSVRGIVIDSKKLYFVANQNRVGVIDLKTSKSKIVVIKSDTLAIEFRSIAQTKSHIFVLSVGNPALLYKIDKKTMTPKLVYSERHEKIFYDSLQFFDNQNGIAMGDPINNSFCILSTNNGGETWSKIPDENLPKLNNGEAAFAASNSTLVLRGNTIWLASGGQSARVFISKDLGKTWDIAPTPIIQGSTMTGIFSMDFYDQKIGFIAGGYYDKPTQNWGNKAYTIDGGNTWQLIAENRGFGYASCVQFSPNSNGTRLASVGATGLYLSEDSGHNWKQLSTDNALYVLKFLDQKTIIAAGQNKILKILIL